MRIAGTEYNISGKYLEIFLSGCLHKNKCKGTCINIELWDFNVGIDIRKKAESINIKITEFNDMIDYLVVTGGEPLDQDKKELLDFLFWLTAFNKPIILFTSYEFNEIDKNILDYVDYVKTGPYLENEKGENKKFIFTLASLNQNIYKKEQELWKTMMM